MITLSGNYATIPIGELLELYLCQLEHTGTPYRYTHREKNAIVKQTVYDIRNIIEHSKKEGSDRYGLDDIPF
jgi:hypothetical protein